MARAQADALNTYDQLLHPFDGWTFGAYAHEVGQFGIGEAKGAVNMVAGAIVDTNPALALADGQLASRLSHPLASAGESQEDGEATFPWVVAAATGVEFLAAAPEAAEALAGVRGTNCFVAGTPVQMADGTTEPIGQVKVGEWVKSRNPKTGVTEAKRVTETFTHVAPQVLTLTLLDPKTALPAERITCTPGHPFYVDGKGFVLAGQLGIGTSIVTRAGPALTLSAATWSAAPASGNGLMLGGGPADEASGVRVYNFTVEGDHTYFVGTAGGGVWVHNNSYPAFYEMQLDRAEWGTNRETHFLKANEALLADFRNSSILRSRLVAATGNTEAEIEAAIAGARGKSPVSIGAGHRNGFTWHHSLSSQAGGKEGVMQLVNYRHHADPINRLLYHPGGGGGYAQWALPLGARRN